jgi:hypothetical protein
VWSTITSKTKTTVIAIGMAVEIAIARTIIIIDNKKR